MNKLHVDEHEYAYLKVITLFTSDLPGLIYKKQVERYQEKSFQALRNYVHHSFPDDSDRFPRYFKIIYYMLLVAFFVIIIALGRRIFMLFS